MNKKKNKRIPNITPPQQPISPEAPPAFTALAATNAIFDDVSPAVKNEDIKEAKDWVDTNEK